MRFRADPSSLRGSIAPVVTPFTGDGQLDTAGLRRLIGWQLDSGSHGISLGGSTGEPSAQTPQERIAAMNEAADVIADRVPFLPGTGSARLDETLELTAAAAGLGADAALVITPYYARPAQEGLVQWSATAAREDPELHLALLPLVAVIFTETNPAPAKWVLRQAGLLGSAHVRPPLAGVSEAGQRRITELRRAGAPVLSPPLTDLVGQP